MGWQGPVDCWLQRIADSYAVGHVLLGRCMPGCLHCAATPIEQTACGILSEEALPCRPDLGSMLLS